MGKILLALTMLFSITTMAHESEEISESEMVLQMFERDLSQEFNQATKLYNTVLAADVESDKKCGYIDELKKVLVKCDIGLKQYMGSLGSGKRNYSDNFETDPNTISVRQIRAYQMQDRLNTLFSVLPTFSRNNSCQ